MTRKICVITGSRADYGLLRWVMRGINDEPSLKLQIIATGMHLSPRYGSTYQEIEKDGFEIDYKLDMLIGSNTAVAITKSIGYGVVGFADALERLRPDLIVVLGDRFEIFSAVAAALIAQIPVAHIHGGEITEGNFDDALRHSITKMSHIHFVAADEYRNRVIQLGESPGRVFTVGGLGVDSIKHTQLVNKEDLSEILQFSFQRKNLLVTFHPVTLEKDYGATQLTEMLDALDSFPEVGLIFTLPNADTGSELLTRLIQAYVNERDNSVLFASLGSDLYLSTMACVDGLIGNSSSGLLEAPSMQVGTVNIGNRQRGRIQAKSVISSESRKDEIQSAVYKLLSDEFRHSIKGENGQFGGGGASQKIIEVLKTEDLKSLVKKVFYDFRKDIR